MNQTLRSLASAATGGVVVAAIVLGQPAVAGQLDKVAPKDSVTSKSIKNGAIKGKDLSAPVRASLAKANTALQGIADNSITNPKLADNSVGAAEVAANSLEITDLGADSVGNSELANGAVGINNFNRGGNANATVPALANGACGTTTIDIGDFTFGFMPLVTPGLTAEAGLFVEGARIFDGDEILVRVCNRSGGAYAGDTEQFLWGALF